MVRHVSAALLGLWAVRAQQVERPPNYGRVMSYSYDYFGELSYTYEPPSKLPALLAPHVLMAVAPGGTTEVRLAGAVLRLSALESTNSWNPGDTLRATVSAPPRAGALHQLTPVYSNYGYEPRLGALVGGGAGGGATNVTGSRNRVIFSPPAGDEFGPLDEPGAWARFEYTVSDDAATGATSKAGVVTFVPPSGVLVGSWFADDDEGWTVAGNGPAAEPVAHEPSSWGSTLDHYVMASDRVVDLALTEHDVQTSARGAVAVEVVYDPRRLGAAAAGGAGSDTARWRFVAPPKFAGNFGVCYGGALEFTLAATNFQSRLDGAAAANSARVNHELELAVLRCDTCVLNAGMRLVFPFAALPAADAVAAAAFVDGGAPTPFSLALREAAGWRVDPRNSLARRADWRAPTQCEFIEALSSVAGLELLGDFTSWKESVALDAVALVAPLGDSSSGARGGAFAVQSSIPLCAQGAPDASLCTCGQADEVM